MVVRAAGQKNEKWKIQIIVSNSTFEDFNEAKSNMDHIYNQVDPKAYSGELQKLNYIIPEEAKPIFQQLISCLQERKDKPISILDLGCSYGINAALLKYDITLRELFDHWNEQKQGAILAEIIETDRDFFSNLCNSDGINVIGIDPAEKAVSYAEDVGLLDKAYAINLETNLLSAGATDKLADIDLVASTGCVGYVTEKSFERLLPAVTKGRLPWIGNFVLRMFPFDVIEETLSEWGYVTEKLTDQTFFQRRFASMDEQEQIVEQLSDLGIDPTGMEAEGDLHAEFYLSRPIKDATIIPVEQLFHV